MFGSQAMTQAEEVERLKELLSEALAALEDEARIVTAFTYTTKLGRNQSARHQKAISTILKLRELTHD